MLLCCLITQRASRHIHLSVTSNGKNAMNFFPHLIYHPITNSRTVRFARVCNGANKEKQRNQSIYVKTIGKKRHFCLFKVSSKEPFRASNDIFLISCNQSVRVRASQSSRFNLHPRAEHPLLVSSYNVVCNFQRCQ